jgi:hypothetical protein
MTTPACRIQPILHVENPVLRRSQTHGRKLLRLPVRNSQTPIEKEHEWIKRRTKLVPQYRELQNLVKSEELHTVCHAAGCPNILECWETARPPSSSAVTKPLGVTTSARPTPASPTRSTAMSRSRSPSTFARSRRRHPIEDWVKPQQFVGLKQEADEIGFGGVMSGPLVRSSCRGGLYRQALAGRSVGSRP